MISSMKKIGWFYKWLFLVIVVTAGCVATSGGRMSADEQIALIKNLEGKCRNGNQAACEQVSLEKKKLFEVYGCHCSGKRPKNHPIVRR